MWSNSKIYEFHDKLNWVLRNSNQISNNTPQITPHLSLALISFYILNQKINTKIE